MNIVDLGTPFAAGNTAEVYLFKNKVVKIFKEYLPDSEAVNEAQKQKYAHYCGLFVPKVLEVTKVDGRQALIMEYVQGETVGHLISQHPEQVEYYMNLSIDLQQNIHEHEAHSMESMQEKLSRQIKEAPRLEFRLKKELLGQLNAMTYEKKLCHGDFHFFNLIQSGNEAAVIDWVDASAGDIRADIYRTYLLYSQVSIKWAEMYIELYCKKTGLSKDEIFRWAPIIAAARLSESVSAEEGSRLVELVNHYYDRL
ncbi:aminoglycoside phosphotransferase family protein [Halobacillus trueperi]|uniref:Aminoglycoside phosphotransferase family protein n=1 Tax=Halobacillus trueperi TaxID=156205 RepID=A0A3D8VTB8_9BACI|nr:aminoglycoside phosphotransferase family protein [Halobacillus trueperi]RDY72662.1 aminoglycoside phosphotransferase family protein [Halobacillus trueperi]